MEQLRKYLEFLETKRCLSLNSLDAYERDIRRFISWLGSRPLEKISQTELQAYIQWLKSQGLKTRSVMRAISALSGFYGFLEKENLLEQNPFDDIKRLRPKRNIPTVLSSVQMEKLLQCPVTFEPEGLRDRAILELLYASGLRVSELCNLNMDDIDLEAGKVEVVNSDGSARLVPVSPKVLSWVKEYIRKVRPRFGRNNNDPSLFISRRGTALSRQAVWYRIKHYAKLAGIEQPVSPHTFRSTFASHCLGKGMAVENVQVLLGHSDISTTQIYTKSGG